MQTQQTAPGVTPPLVCLLLGEFCVRRAVPRVNFSQYLSSRLALLSAEKPQRKRVPIRAHSGRKMDYLCITCPDTSWMFFKKKWFCHPAFPQVSAEKSRQKISPNSEGSMHDSLCPFLPNDSFPLCHLPYLGMLA